MPDGHLEGVGIPIGDDVTFWMPRLAVLAVGTNKAQVVLLPQVSGASGSLGVHHRVWLHLLI